jgi:hypothetical protein
MIMLRSTRLFLAVGLTLAVAGLAVAVSRPAGLFAQNQGPDVTVYNSNIALVKETRSFDLTRGVNTVLVTDVPAGILPDSVYFRSLTDPAAVVLEQNFEYDIVGSDKLLQKYVDQTIRITTADGAVHEGVLLSGSGDVILQDEKGGVAVFRSDQIRQFSFPALPEGLITRPTLVWSVEATRGGRHQTELAYLTNGLNWEANYVLVLASDSKSLDLDGWVTLDNRSGATYRNARLKLVAGDIQRAVKEMPMAVFRAEVEMMATPAPAVEQRQFAEYHLYELQRPVTIKDQQTKQVQFITATKVPATKRYIFDASIPYGGYGPIYDPGFGNTGNTKVDVRLTFNTGPEGVNAQLPRGIIRMYQADVDGSPLLIGEDTIDHTPKGEDVTLTIGRAFDLVGERTQTDFRRIGDNVVEESYRIELRNQKETEAVTIRVIEHLSRGVNWEILKASPEQWEKVDSATIAWEVPVPAKGKATITYTVRYTF